MTSYLQTTLQRCGTRWALLALACLTLLSGAATVHAQNENQGVAVEQLFATLASAQTQSEGRAAESAIWQFWFDQSPTAEIRAALDIGMERRRAYDYATAEQYLDEVVSAAPDYAEGYNQRAFVRFLRENFSDAQADLETVLALEPNHFGALSGLFHILRRQGRQTAALDQLRRAVEIHPWIQERSSLPEDLWPDSYREIHDPEQRI